MKLLFLAMTVLLLSSSFSKVHAQNVRQHNLGKLSYNQPKKSSRLDSAEVFQFNFTSNNSDLDSKEFSLNNLQKTEDHEFFDFIIQLEEIDEHEEESKLKTKKKKIKREEKEDSVVTYYYYKSEVFSKYKMTVIAQNFDTLLTVSRSSTESFFSSKFLSKEEAKEDLKKVHRPYNICYSDICRKLEYEFEDYFNSQTKMVSFKIYKLKWKESSLFKTAALNLEAAYKLSKNYYEWDDARRIALQSITYNKQFLKELSTADLKPKKKRMLAYAANFNLAQGYLLLNDFALSYYYVNEAMAVEIRSRSYDKLIHRITYKNACRVDFLTNLEEYPGTE